METQTETQTNAAHLVEALKTEATKFVVGIAHVCHEANRAYCQELGDHSQPSWDGAPDWQRTSAINGVMFHIRNPNASASASHENWLKEKLADGWKHGPVKDPEKKEHPCCLAFSDLPDEQQRKDFLFKAIVGALAP